MVGLCVVVLLLAAGCDGRIKGRLSTAEGAFASGKISGRVVAAKLAGAALLDDCAASEQVSLRRVTDHGLDSAAVATTGVAADGTFTFTELALAGDQSYLLLSSACGTLLSRPVSGSREQNITPGTTILGYALSGASSFTNLSLASDKRGDLSKLTGALQKAATPEDAFHALAGSAELKALFFDLFGFTAESLVDVPPMIVGVAVPTAGVGEDASFAFGVSATHWLPTYHMAYQWRWDEAPISQAASGNFATSSDSQGAHTLSITVGQKNAAGQLDQAKPVAAQAATVTVANNTAAAAPLLTVQGSSGQGTPSVNQRELTLILHTGEARQNCASFERLALVEGSQAAPSDAAAYSLTCTAAPEQTVPFTLADGVDGLRILRLWARDSAGNISTKPLELAVRLKRHAPQFTALPLANLVPAGFLNAAKHSLTLPLVGNLQASDYDSAAYQVVSAAAICDSSLIYTATIPSVDTAAVTGDGSYKVCVKLSDTAGNPPTFGASSAFTAKTSLPSFTLLPLAGDVADSVLDLAEYTYGTHAIVGSVTGGHYDQASYAVISAAHACDASLSYASAVPQSHDPALATNGSYKVCVQLVDQAGNPAAFGASPSFNVRTDTPAFVSLTLAGGAADGYLSAADKAAAPFALANAAVMLNATLAEYRLVPSTTSCDGSLTYNASIPQSDSSDFTGDGSYRICVKVSEQASTNPPDYGGSASFVLKTTLPTFGSLPLAGDAANGYINAAEHSGSSALVDTSSVGTNYTAAAYAVTSSGASCDGSLTYSTSVPTSQSSALTSDSSYKVCVQLSDSANPTVYGASPAFAFKATVPVFTSLALANEASGGYINAAAHSLAHDIVASLSATSYDTVAYAIAASATTCDGALSYNASVPQMNAASLSPDGTYKVCVKLSDSAGNVTYGASPNVVVKATSLGAFSINAMTSPSNATNVTVAWGASSGSGSYQLKVTSDSGCATPVQSYSSLTTTSQALATLADGTYYICVTAVDAAGNATTASNNALSLALDRVAPAVTLGSLSAARTNTGPVTLTATFSGADSIPLSNATITLNKTGTADATVAVTGSGLTTRTITLSSITGDGTLSVTLPSGSATDSAGNVTTAATSATLTVDNSAPSVSAVTFNGGSSSTATRVINVAVTASDNSGGTGLAQIRVAERASTCTQMSNVTSFAWPGGSSNTFSYLLSSFANTKYICVWALDKAGNYSVISAAGVGTAGTDLGVVLLNTPDPPSFTSFTVTNNTVPANGATFASGDNALISWTISSPGGLPVNPITAIQYSTDGGSTWALAPTGATASTYGSTTAGATSWTGSYSGWDAPTSAPFLVRIYATDVNGSVGYSVSPVLSGGKWSIWAGLPGYGDGASATKALIGIKTAGGRQMLVVSKTTGHIFFIDTGVGIRKIDASTGIVSTYIAFGTNGLNTGSSSMAQDSLGYIYFHTGTGLRRFDPSLATASVSVYFEGGTQTADGIDASQVLMAGGPGFAFDANDNVYWMQRTTSCAVTANAANYVFKVARSGTSAGAVTLLAGNGSAGNPTSGQSAVSQPLQSTECRRNSLAVNEDGSIIYMATGSSFYKIINGIIYTVNQTYSSSTLSRLGSWVYNPRDAAGKPFYFAPSYSSLTSLNVGIFRFAATTTTGGETFERFIGGGTAADCNADGLDPSASCPAAGDGGLFVTPDGDLYWGDGRYNYTGPWRIRTISTGKVQTVAGSTGVTGFGGNRANASFSALSALSKDAAGNIYAFDYFARYILKFPRANSTMSAYVGTGNPAIDTAFGGSFANQSLGGAGSAVLGINNAGNMYFRDGTCNLDYIDNNGLLQKLNSSSSCSPNLTAVTTSVNGTVIPTVTTNYGINGFGFDSNDNIIIAGGYQDSAGAGGPPRVISVNPSTGVMTTLIGNYAGTGGALSNVASADGVTASTATLRCDTTGVWSSGTTQGGCSTGLATQVISDVVYFTEVNRIRTISTTDGTGVLGTLKNADGTVVALASTAMRFQITGNYLYYLTTAGKLYCAWLGTSGTQPSTCNNTSLGPATGIPAITAVQGYTTGLVVDADGNILVSTGQTLLKYTP